MFTECPNFSTLSIASAANINEDTYLLIDDEIFHVRGISGTSLTTLRGEWSLYVWLWIMRREWILSYRGRLQTGRSGSIAASHASGAAVYIISDTAVQNAGVAGSDSMRASQQASTSLQTGGILRRCATITLDPFKADDTDNVYRNWLSLVFEFVPSLLNLTQNWRNCWQRSESEYVEHARVCPISRLHRIFFLLCQSTRMYPSGMLPSHLASASLKLHESCTTTANSNWL